MNENLIEIFGKFLKASRDSGADIVKQYKLTEGHPKSPSEEQTQIIKLIESLNNHQYEQLKTCVNYSLESTLFKLIDLLENGKAEYSFELNISDSKYKQTLIGPDIDNELKHLLFEGYVLKQDHLKLLILTFSLYRIYYILHLNLEED